jgi:alpha-glucosidase
MCLLLCQAAAAQDQPRERHAAVSPDQRVHIELFLRAAADAEVPKSLCYRVTFNEQTAVHDSALKLRLASGRKLGANCVIERSIQRQVDSQYEQYPGKRSLVRDHCTELTVFVRETEAPQLRWQIVARAYNDGVAFRYRFPPQPDWQELELADEHTEFVLPDDSVATALPLASFRTSHENRYEHRLLAELPTGRLMGLPLLVELPATGWMAIAEAQLTDYAGLYLTKRPAAPTQLISRLSPRDGEPQVAVRAKLPHESPWRVVLLSKQPESLVESDLILNLNAPCAVADVSWIRPGKTTFPWWNGYYEEGVPFEPGLNTATALYYIDFCAEHGIPCHSLDGVANTAWYGGPIVPYEGADPTTAVEGLDLAAVLDHARQKGVRLRLWLHWQAAQAHMARAFPLYRQWGIEGVMIDFMDRDDQPMVNFQHDLLRLAADHQLTVTFHGVAPPTGLERTFPHLLSSEAVLNLEYDKWDENGVAPEHEVTVPLTRMLAGPLDFHQGSFRTVPVSEFRPRNEAPHIIGTPCRTLASYVVFQNHLSMIADYPSSYRNHPLLPVLVQIPTTWDDTHAVSAMVGKWAVIARRRGSDWWIGAMNDRRPRDMKVPLKFLSPGRFRADIYHDQLAMPERFVAQQQRVTAADTLVLPLAASGGALVRLSPTDE